MKQLKETYIRNGLHYKLLKRNDKVAMYELGFGTSGYEVDRIHLRKEKNIKGTILEAGEALPTNEQFGTEGSKAFSTNNRDGAEKYFIYFSNALEAEK